MRTKVVLAKPVCLAAALCVVELCGALEITFDPPVNYPATGGVRPDRSLAVGDLNGDRLPDVAVVIVNTGTSGIQVFLNNGDGTLGTPSSYFGSGRAADSLALADLDGDLDLDVAVANAGVHPQGGRTIALYQNDGNGTFAAFSTLSCGEPTGVALADLDGDGDVDLAGIDWDFDVCIYLNLGDGTMSPLADFDSLKRSQSIGAGDLDGDDDFDLVVANSLSVSTVTIGFNDGNAAFGRPVDIGSLASSVSMVLADLDGDADLDLAVGTSGWPTIPETPRFVAVMLNNGDGTFAPQVEYDPGPPIAEWDTGGEPLSLAAADFDGDGDLDLAVANCNNCSSGGVNLGPSNVAIMPNNGDGTFAEALHFDAGPPSTWGGPRSIAAADMDDDGDLDVITMNQTGQQVREYTVSVLINTTPRGNQQGDFDGDGDVDLFDVAAYFDCVTGPGGGVPPDCATFDFDADDDVDFLDHGAFQLAYTGP